MPEVLNNLSILASMRIFRINDILVAMKKLHVFNYWDRPQAGLLKEVLAQEGIECTLRNDQLSSALGEIPFTECYPELWVIDDEAFPRAQTFLKSWLKSDPATSDPWVCPTCGERIEGQFGACWACGRLRESV